MIKFSIICSKFDFVGTTEVARDPFWPWKPGGVVGAGLGTKTILLFSQERLGRFLHTGLYV